MAERTTVEILRAARERISDPERWTRREYARDEHGSGVEPNSDAAVCWCLAGSLFAEEGFSAEIGDRPGRDDSEALDLLVKAAQEIGRAAVAHVNDRGDHETALAVCDRAIELAEAAS